MRKNKNLMRGLLSAFAGVTLLAAFTSCEEKDYTSRMPTFAGFLIDPAAPAPNDSITITAKQLSKGTLLNGTYYQWTITDSYDSVVCTQKQELIYDHQPSDPVLGYKLAPDARTGTYKVTFYARYKFSGQGESYSGSLTSPGLGYSGSITGKSGATYGECNGEFTFKVQ